MLREGHPLGTLDSAITVVIDKLQHLFDDLSAFVLQLLHA